VINQSKNNFNVDGDVDDFLEEREREREHDPSSDYNSEFSQKPNITLPEYNNLLNNQKPLDLPEN
jgi:hypothetical protein